ncbi:MAG: hypothetical protein Q9174_002154, partial [Haloplaca sp. 1 TL-2023]
MGRLNYTNRKTDGLKLGQIIAKDATKRIPPGTGSKSALRDPVVELDVTGRALGSDGFAEAADGLVQALEYREDGTDGKVLQLEELCLKTNRLDAKCLPALARIVRLAASDLRDLDLSDNLIEVDDTEGEKAWQDFLEAFASCCMLRRLDLSGNNLGTKAFEVLARVYTREPGIDCFISEGDNDITIRSSPSSRRNTMIPAETLQSQTRKLSLASPLDVPPDLTTDTLDTPISDHKLGHNIRHASKSPESMGQSTLPSLSHFCAATQGLRSIPYLIFSHTGLNDPSALYLSYVVSCHHHTDQLLKCVPSTKASHHLQQMENYDHASGCQGIVYLPNDGISGPAFKMLELSESARSYLIEDERPPLSPHFSRAHRKISTPSRKVSLSHSSPAHVTPGSRRRSGTKGEVEDLTDEEAIKGELDRARSRIQGDTLKEIGLHSNDLWRTAFQMLTACRPLCPLRKQAQEKHVPESDKTNGHEAPSSPAPPVNNPDFPSLPKPSKPFVGYLDPFATPLATKSTNQPATPKSKKPLPKLKTNNPSPLSIATSSPADASPKTGLPQAKSYRSDLPLGLPEGAW